MKLVKNLANQIEVFANSDSRGVLALRRSVPNMALLEIIRMEGLLTENHLVQ